MIPFASDYQEVNVATLYEWMVKKHHSSGTLPFLTKGDILR